MLKATDPTGLLKLGYKVHYDDEGRAKRYYAGLANNYALGANTADGNIALLAFDGVAKKVSDLEQIFDFFKAAKVEKVEEMKPTDMGIKVPATSKEEFAEKMAEIAKGGDTEGKHEDADKLMCQVLTEWGYGDGVKIFEEMSKWYT